MPASKPTIYLIAGCNGAGKTTFAKEFLPNEVKCLRFLNADEMARGLSPLDPAAGAMKAARLLLREIRDALRSRQTFGLETTLSGLTYVRMLINARERSYAVKLFYLWLPSAVVAIRRVRERAQRRPLCSRQRHSPPLQTQPPQPGGTLSSTIADANRA